MGWDGWENGRMIIITELLQ